MEKDYWNLTFKEKENIINKITSGKKVDSLSNNTWIHDNLVVKKCPNFWKRKLLIYKKLNYKIEVVNGYLIREVIPGRLLFNSEMNDLAKIEELFDRLKRIDSIEISSVLNIYNMFEKFKRKEEIIKSFLIPGDLEKVGFESLLREISLLENNLVCHGDLNRENILIDGKEINIIDFDETTLSNKYHDFSILISNWNIDAKIIDEVCKSLELDFYLLIRISIVWCILFISWNTKKKVLIKGKGFKKYEKKIEKFHENLSILLNYL